MPSIELRPKESLLACSGQDQQKLPEAIQVFVGQHVTAQAGVDVLQHKLLVGLDDPQSLLQDTHSLSSAASAVTLVNT